MQRRSGGAGMRKTLVIVLTLVIVVLYYTVFSPFARQAQGSLVTTHGVSQRVVENGPPQLSRWQRFDWLPKRDKETVLNGYVEHANSPQWEEGERIYTCNNAEADAENLKGVDILRRHLMKDHLHPADSPRPAKEHFERAIEIEPICYTARLNLCILLPVVTKNFIEDTQRCFKLLAGFPTDHILHAKSLLWVGITLELYGLKEEEANDVYQKAFDKKPSLSMQYFGKTANIWKGKKLITLFKDTRMHDDTGLKIQMECLKKLLLYTEFAKHFSGFNHITKAEALAFHDNWFFLAKDLIPPYVLKALQSCYRSLVGKGILKFDDKQAKRYYHYNSPPARYIAAVYGELVSRLWARPMKTTYTYMGGYPGGSELKPHVDRVQCEITMSLSIDVNPDEETCPLGVRLEPKKLSKERSIGNIRRPSDPAKEAVVHPRPGDAFVFRGRAMVHWRERIPMELNCTNLFFHYVLLDFEGKVD